MVFICKDKYPVPSPYDSYFENFGFLLSDFQKYAIEAIVEGHHTLVTAHTGSGKTLPAEFAIQHFTKTGKKVIYCSPIKALSNQKYYDFRQKFPDISVGLMTGDIKTNPTADVLIMTTEILMNYLFTNHTKKEDSGKEKEDRGKEEEDRGKEKEDRGQEEKEGKTIMIRSNSNDDLSEGQIIEFSHLDLLSFADKEPEKRTLMNEEGHTDCEFSMRNGVAKTLDFQIDLQNELAAVVFDEVHYINDYDRGHVWEKSMLMLPKHVQMIMLSATIDKPEKFAEWIQSISSPEKNVYLASNTHRVVPLTHYGFLTTTESVFKNIKDKVLQLKIRETTNKLITLRTAEGAFQEQNYVKMNNVKELFDKNRLYSKRKHVLNKLCEHMRENEMFPAIAFVFSRKNVELCAQEITTNILEFDSKIPYTARTMCEQIIRRLPNFQEYLELPEYNQLVGLLEKGVAIHHSGMIPVLREIVEFMISKKYVKLLFATESFAIGLDCPIRTAVFTSLTKFDNSGMRFLLPHEYMQAAGRAGRRGQDVVGHVIHLNNLFDMPYVNQYKDILCGSPQKLVSKFRVSYPTILNLMKNQNETGNARLKHADFLDFVSNSMVARDYAENKISQQKRITELNEKLILKHNQLSILRTPIEVCREYMALDSHLNMLNHKKRAENSRKMTDLKDVWKWILQDIEYIKDLDTLREEVKNERTYYAYLESYMSQQIENICSILEEKGFIQKAPVDIFSLDEHALLDSSSESYFLTDLGIVASNSAEVNCILAGYMVIDWNYFANFSITQIIQVFSCFTDVKVSQDYRTDFVNCKDSFVKHRVKEIENMCLHYEDLEKDKSLETGIYYLNLLNFAMIDEIGEWVQCDTEQNCKYFIQNRLAEKEISVGDFTKAVLKISTITKEFSNICEKMGQIECLRKLASIDSLILKYITMNQSLYV